MGMGGLFQAPDPYDKPFKREELDYPRLSFALYYLGYHPYQLTRGDNGHKQVVWAKGVKDVMSYAPGVVEPMHKAPIGQMLTFVLVLDKADGGGINVNGTLLPCQTC